jgi:flagellar basal-body rod protein FlgF
MRNVSACLALLEDREMESPSLVLLSNQEALQRAIDIVANNVANSSTTGFKREGIEFDTLLTQPAPGESIDFVIDRATYRDASTGPINPTGNPLDLAIQGAGYFPIQTPQGTRYTRAGAFQLNTDGQIVTLSGDPLLGDGDQPITVPSTTTEINISADGFVSARVDNGVGLSQLGKVNVVQFDNEQALQPTGNGLYATDQTPAPADQSGIVQGALEQSNVQPVTEITQMIQIMRSYEQTVNLIGQENARIDDALTKLSKTTA